MLTLRSPAKRTPPGDRRAETASASEPTAWLRYAGWFVVALGSSLRVGEYLANRSLSIDESYLALNLIQKSPVELTRALDFNQAAPVGFLEAEKLAITILGRDEYALRLLPLMASLFALVLFFLIAQKLLAPPAAIAAVGAFAFLDPLVYYSATVKQYAFDVAAAVVIFALGFVFERRRPTQRVEILTLTLFGGVLVWFSHASVFALGGLAILLVIRCIGDRDWRRVPALLAMVGVWAASFGVEFQLTRSNLVGIVGSVGAERGTLLTPSQAGPSWFDRSTDRLRYLAGLEDTATGDPVFGSLPSGVNRALTVLVVVVAAAGFVSLLRRRTRLALFVATPPVLAVAASALHQYPLVGRTLLFVLPSMALCIGEGAQAMVSLSIRRRSTAIVAAIITSSLVAIAVLPAIHAFQPRKTEEMKQALTYLGMHRRADDTLYVAMQAQYAFAYYHLCDCSTFDPYAAWPFSTTSGRRDEPAAAVQTRSPKLIVAASPPPADEVLPKPLMHQARVWVLFADTPYYQKRTLLRRLDRYGRRLEHFQVRGPAEIASSLYLYDLRGPR